MTQTALTQDAIRELFERSGALLSGHFRLSSGLHSDQYFQCALVLSQPDSAEKLGRALAESARGFERPDVVVSPALGGLIIGHEVARALGVPFLFTERQDGVMTMRRGFSLKAGQKALVVEDVITTGKSTGEVIEVLKAAGAKVVGAASIVLRTEKPPALGEARIASLATLPVQSYTPEACPLCAGGKPLIKPGSRPG